MEQGVKKLNKKKMKERIEGWFHPEEGKWYQDQVKKFRGGWIVEIGCWKGLSISYLAPVLIGNPQRLWCIDNWKGSKDQYAKLYRELLDQQKSEGRPIPIQFRENLKQLKIPHKILEIDSLEAVKNFQDESCSVVFLDASHDYLSITADLKSWWPKVRRKGILAGHDFSNDHPELIRAVESFSKEYSIPLKRGPRTIFYFIKP
ncbi:MAG: class I SAM-dependent methyltransferase [Candidatus Helarchaeota archaeon]|nr:class I SAM-dependent methyltransferase [Candidatus Helarchaeota archaeon]